MITKLLKIENGSEDAVSQAADILRRGGLAAIPTETVYGLAANALDCEAVSRIFYAKGRPQDNPLIVHIADFSELDALVTEIPDTARALAARFWPGPLTMIMKKSSIIPDEVSAGLDTVAVRMPSHPLARAVIKTAGIPLAAPSANLSGKPSPTTAAHVMNDLGGRIDAVLDGGECSVGVESTVVSLVGKPRLLRPGGISHEQLSEVIGTVIIDKAVTEQLEAGVHPTSPGMKYKHYSPKAKVVIVKGPLEQFVRYVNENAGEKCAVMCFEGEENAVPLVSVTYGAQADSASQARGLFSALRRVDELGIETVYARCPQSDGVGLAVYNRLLRAAAFDVVQA